MSHLCPDVIGAADVEAREQLQHLVVQPVVHQYGRRHAHGWAVDNLWIWLTMCLQTRSNEGTLLSCWMLAPVLFISVVVEANGSPLQGPALREAPWDGACGGRVAWKGLDTCRSRTPSQGVRRSEKVRPRFPPLCATIDGVNDGTFTLLLDTDREIIYHRGLTVVPLVLPCKLAMRRRHVSVLPFTSSIRFFSEVTLAVMLLNTLSTVLSSAWSCATTSLITSSSLTSREDKGTQKL